MNTEEIHKIIRWARARHYDLYSWDDLYEYHNKYMCNCVRQLSYDSEITGVQYREVSDYIQSLLGGYVSLFRYLSFVKGVKIGKSMKAAQHKFWDDLLGEDE